ncbi:MAG TPA: diphthine--ammonia ligase [Candidatus Dormibacteraeota bacterium]|nr:diphthine--ammonia ligase [Candidatus Dormibacteraeota bacterium]
MPGRFALMWSGGKDSALALHRARARGLDVQLLLNFYDQDTGRVRFHATPIALLHEQAAAIGIELRAIGTTWPEMDSALQEELGRLRGCGFTGIVFGDIHLADVRAWYEGRVRAAGLEHVEPLWGDPSPNLLSEFVKSGGRAVVTCVDLNKLDESWLGRIIDDAFVAGIAAIGIDACGENGEYHSFAFDGPVFARPVSWVAGERRTDGTFEQLDLRNAVDNQNFREDVRLSGLVDPRPTLANLARNTGLTYDAVVHHALVRYASSGAEALLSLEPHALRELIAARKAQDWSKVGSIIDWLEAGLQSTSWR